MNKDVTVLSIMEKYSRSHRRRGQDTTRKRRQRRGNFFTLVLLVGVDAPGGRKGSKGLEGVEERGDTNDPEPLGEETCGERGPANEIEHDDEGEGVNGREEGEKGG